MGGVVRDRERVAVLRFFISGRIGQPSSTCLQNGAISGCDRKGVGRSKRGEHTAARYPCARRHCDIESMSMVAT